MQPQNVARRKKISVNCNDFESGIRIARERYRSGEFLEAFDVYEQVAGVYSELSVEVLAELYDCYCRLPYKDRYSLYQARYYNFDIKAGEKVLDVSNDEHPFPFATHLVNVAFGDNSSGKARVLSSHAGLEMVECQIEMMPFGYKEFDFVYCSHILERVLHPNKACRELMRIGRRGYIETSTKGKEIFFNNERIPKAIWGVEILNSRLLFNEYKPEEIEGVQSNILWNMFSTPLTIREKAFSALVYLKAELVNTMFLWEGEFDYDIIAFNPNRKCQGVEQLSNITRQIPTVNRVIRKHKLNSSHRATPYQPLTEEELSRAKPITNNQSKSDLFNDIEILNKSMCEFSDVAQKGIYDNHDLASTKKDYCMSTYSLSGFESSPEDISERLELALASFAKGAFREAELVFTGTESNSTSRVLTTPFVKPTSLSNLLWLGESQILPVADAFPKCFMQIKPPQTAQTEELYLAVLEDAIITANNLIITKDKRLLAQGTSHLIPTNPCIFHSKVYPEVKLSGPEHVMLELPTSMRLVDTPCIFFVAGDTLDCGRSYYHWMIDYLSRLSIIEQFPELKNLPLLCYEKLQPFQAKCLEMLNIHQSRLLRKKPEEALYCRKVYVASSTSHPAVVYPEVVAFLRKHLLEYASHSVGIEKVYISRRREQRRKLVNEIEIETMMKRRGFEIVDPSLLPLAKQIALFAEATIVVGPHGAGLVNAVFSTPRATIIEFMTIPTATHFATLASACGHDYHNLATIPLTEHGEKSSSSIKYALPIENLRNLLDYVELKRLMSKTKFKISDTE